MFVKKLIFMFNEDIPMEVITPESNEINLQAAKKSKRSNIPSSDIDLVSLAHNVADVWAEKELKLLWLDIDSFNTTINNFDNSLDEKTNVNARRNPITARIRELTEIIDKKTEQIKYYLAEKYDGRRNAIAHYAKFGIYKQRSSYKLPRDQEARVKALKQLLDSLISEGFGDKTFGTAFWTEIYNEYKTLVESVTDTISSVSGHVGIKKELRAELKKGLNALIHLIKANYPNTYQSELRVWGFQKEKY